MSGTTTVYAPVIIMLAVDFRSHPVSLLGQNLPLSRLILAPIRSAVDPLLDVELALSQGKLEDYKIFLLT